MSAREVRQYPEHGSDPFVARSQLGTLSIAVCPGPETARGGQQVAPVMQAEGSRL